MPTIGSMCVPAQVLDHEAASLDFKAVHRKVAVVLGVAEELHTRTSLIATGNDADPDSKRFTPRTFSALRKPMWPSCSITVCSHESEPQHKGTPLSLPSIRVQASINAITITAHRSEGSLNDSAMPIHNPVVLLSGIVSFEKVRTELLIGDVTAHTLYRDTRDRAFLLRTNSLDQSLYKAPQYTPACANISPVIVGLLCRL